MRLKYKPWAKEYLENDKEYFVAFQEDNKINWKKEFGNDNPISLEVGMGKGDFVIGMAQANPNINFVAIEMYPSVQVIALKKLEELNLKNVKLMSFDARQLKHVFKENEIQDVYLNFSDPWPKVRHDKRRLTYKLFIDIYKHISNSGNLIFKTDNIGLFEWSVEHIKEYPLEITYLTNDLWSEDVFNIKTEYEIKFSNKGFKINKLIAKL